MSVDIEPLELSFRRPFTIEVSQTLKIKNPGTSPLAFKVKTTAPKQYCVRPNAGRIEPGQGFDVTVLLQAMKADPPLDAKCRDKFLVQSAPITPDKEFASIASVLESTEKGYIVERKIRVNWLPATDSSERNLSSVQPLTLTPSKQSAMDASTDTPDAPRTYSSPGTAESTSASAPPPYVSDKDDDDVRPEAPKSVVSKASTAVSNTAHTVVEDLKTKVTQLEAELASYKDNGLRQRNVKNSTGESVKTSTTAVVQHAKQAAEGVPVRIVALLCLISFLLAYFLF